MRVRPKKLVFRGRMAGSGLWFSTRLLGTYEARRRVLERWEPDARVYDTGDGLVLLWSRTRPLLSEQEAGAVLVDRDGRLVAAPLAPDEIASLGAPPGSVVLVRGGVAEVPRLVAVDPSSWIDLEGFEACPVESLGRPKTKPRLIETTKEKTVRAILREQLPRAARERNAILSELAAVEKRARNRRSATARPRPTWRERLHGWLASSVEGGGRGGAATPTAAMTLWRPSWFRVLQARLRTWLAGLVAGTLLGRALGRRQARYLRQMVELFERKDFEEALRYAIPFSSLPGAPKPPALTTPSPRAELRLVPRRAAEPTSAILFAADLYAHVKALYIRSARELEEKGEVERAAFVLFELLDAPEEGIALLERHRRFDLAAKMAEARELPAGLVVRLWFLAGDPRRAVAVARRTGAYGDAILRLERGGHGAHDAATRLRLIWADDLASAGELAGAVDAIWPVAEARSLAHAFIERGIACGGPTRGRLLAKKLALVPHSAGEVRDLVLQHLRDPSAEARHERTAFARALAEEKPSHLGPELGRAVSRALIVDASVHGDPLSLAAFASLRPFVSDASLRADLPTVEARPGLPRGPLSFAVGADDTGLHALGDAVWLPNGQALVALGELGVVLTTPDGRTVTRFEQPAERLVLADNGHRAIVMARRGNVWRLSRIDTMQRRARRWCEARIESWAPVFDGRRWFVGFDGALVAIDVTADDWCALWRVKKVGRIASLGASHGHLCFVSHDAERWRYDLQDGGPVLRHRDSLSTVADALAVSVAANGLTAVHRLVGDRGEISVERDGGTHTFAAEGTVESLQAYGDGVAVLSRHDRRRRASWLDAGGACRATFDLAGARRISLHPTEPWLAVADDRGRLLRVDRHLDRVDRDLRL